MTLTILVSLSLLAVGTAATKQAGGSLSERVQTSGMAASFEASSSARSESDPAVTYWHDKAVKRLHLLGKRERRIVALLVRIHKLTHRSSSSTIAHRAGWLCIHSREGAWNAQTGNGYYGGLQMTYGWMGLVKNAALLSPDQQMAAAEEGYRRSGYSHRWLAGQWPNTYPPCAGLF